MTASGRVDDCSRSYHYPVAGGRWYSVVAAVRQWQDWQLFAGLLVAGGRDGRRLVDDR